MTQWGRLTGQCTTKGSAIPVGVCVCGRVVVKMSETNRDFRQQLKYKCWGVSRPPFMTGYRQLRWRKHQQINRGWNPSSVKWIPLKIPRLCHLQQKQITSWGVSLSPEDINQSLKRIYTTQVTGDHAPPIRNQSGMFNSPVGTCVYH